MLFGHQILLLHLLGEFHLAIGPLNLAIEFNLLGFHFFVLVEIGLQRQQFIFHLTQLGFIFLNPGTIVLQQTLRLVAEKLVFAQARKGRRFTIRPLGDQTLCQLLVVAFDLGDFFIQIFHIRMILTQALTG